MATTQKRKRFGDILIDNGLITPTQLQQALAHGKEMDIKIGEALLELGFVDELSIAKTISRQLKIPFVDLENIVLDPEIVTLIPEVLARKHKVIALGKRPGEILVAFSDPLNIFANDEVSRQLKEKLVTCVGMQAQILKAIDRMYAGQKPASKGNGEEGADESAAVAAVNEIMLKAVRDSASDIHIEPIDEKVRIRTRVDGLLRKIKEFPLDMLPSIISRIKILSQLDIGERRKPQDGRFEIPVSGRYFDIRVSTLPLNDGEKVVMRLLDKSKIKIDLKDLGFEVQQQEMFKHHLHSPHEIILVTGPTGSGKTTSLYAALNYINSIEKNIVTVEDPVEYELDGINQVQVNPKADLTFATSLRSILRQDPDIIMIGEIRDVETAEIAIQAALTGHLVLSTLHTNDASGAIARLIDMGIPPFLIASALGVVLSQRLVRLLCPECKKSFKPPQSVQEDLGLEFDPDRNFFESVGCAACEHTGFKGRIALYEVIRVGKSIQKLIMDRASSHEISRQARSDGYPSLRQSGINKLLNGLTTLEEVLRVSLDAKD